MVFTAFLSCKEDIHYHYSFLTAYSFEVSDTLLSASAHSFSLYPKPFDGEPLTYKWDILRVDEYDEDLPVDPWLMVSFLDGKGGTVLDWLKMEKKRVNGKDVLMINVSANDTGKYRAARVFIGEDAKDYYNSGEVIIAQSGDTSSEKFTVRVKYKGVEYSSDAHLNENNEIVYENEVLDSLINYLSNREGVETIITENNVVNFYDSNDIEVKPGLKSLIKKIDESAVKNKGFIDLPLSRGNDGYQFIQSGVYGYCALFDDSGFSDTSIYYNGKSYDDYYDVPELSSYKLNDKVTSIALQYSGLDITACAVLTAWEDSNFNYDDNSRTKHRISFVASYSNKKVSWTNLKSVPCLNSKNSWNDRISSISFYFGIYNQNLNNY